MLDLPVVLKSSQTSSTYDSTRPSMLGSSSVILLLVGPQVGDHAVTLRLSAAIFLVWVSRASVTASLYFALCRAFVGEEAGESFRPMNGSVTLLRLSVCWPPVAVSGPVFNVPTPEMVCLVEAMETAGTMPGGECGLDADVAACPEEKAGRKR